MQRFITIRSALARKFLAPAIAVVVLSLAAGCGDLGQESVSPRSNLGSVLHNGGTVSGMLETEVEIREGGQFSSGGFVDPLTFRATMNNGIAHPDVADIGDASVREALGHLRVAEIDDGSTNTLREVRQSFRDESGRLHELVLTAAGSRLLGADHFVDGEHFTTTSQSWRQEDRVWILSEITTSGFGELEDATVRINVPAVNWAQPNAFRMGLNGVHFAAASTVDWLRPAEAHAAPVACMGPLLVFAGTSMMFAGSLSTPATWWAVAGTGSIYMGSMINYANCVLMPRS